MNAKQEGEQNIIVIRTSGRPIIVEIDEDQPPPVNGCPAKEGRAACWDRCGGGAWPGTNVDTDDLTAAVTGSGNINPIKLGCQPLQDNVAIGLRQWRKGL